MLARRLVPLICLFIALGASLPAQLTEAALSAFRKDARVRARDQYALLAAASSTDRREVAVLLDAASTGASSMDAAIITLRDAPLAAKPAAAAALRSQAAAFAQSLKSPPAFPPAAAADLSRLISTAALSSSNAQVLSALEDALISLCPPARKQSLAALSLLFREGGAKIRISWLSALCASLCLDPLPLETVSRDVAGGLNASREARRLLAALAGAAAVERDIRSRPLAWSCAPLFLLQTPTDPSGSFGAPGSALFSALEDPRPWIGLLDPGIAGLARSLPAFAALLPQEARARAFPGMKCAGWRTGLAPTEAERKEAVLLLASFEASLPPETAVAPGALPKPQEKSLELVAAIAASQASRSLLASPGRARERGLMETWLSTLLSAEGGEGRLIISPARLAIVMKRGSLPESLKALEPFLSDGKDFLSADGSGLSHSADSRPLLWSWAFLREAFAGVTP